MCKQVSAPFLHHLYVIYNEFHLHYRYVIYHFTETTAISELEVQKWYLRDRAINVCKYAVDRFKTVV